VILLAFVQRILSESQAKKFYNYVLIFLAHTFTITLAIASCVSLPMDSAAQTGLLDLTFNSTGFVVNNTLGSSNQIHTVVVQNDGKICAMGPVAVLRYNVDGSIDSSFNGNGIVLMDTTRTYQGVLQPDGKIIVVGNTLVNFQSEYCITRYNIDGSLDTSFGVGGRVITNLANNTDYYAYAVVLQSDGKIVIAGGNSDGNWTSQGFLILRFTANGMIDTSFGNNGIVTGPAGYAVSLAQQTDGRLLVAANLAYVPNKDFTVLRYNSNGSVDSTFGDAGKVSTDIASLTEEVNSLALQSDGKILLAGRCNMGPNKNYFAIARYHTNGSLDSSFNSCGIALASTQGTLCFLESIAVKNNGKIVAAGHSYNGTNTDFTILCYNPDGSLDSSFNTNGIVSTDVIGTFDAALAVAAQNDGKIVAAGSAWAAGIDNACIVRYNLSFASAFAYQPLSIEEHSVILYPTVVHSHAVLRIRGSQLVQMCNRYYLVDNSGNIVQANILDSPTPLANLEIKLSNMQQGIHTLHLQCGKQLFTRKFLIVD
jgi:uncharacterized delta-60 repeat protein